MYEAPLEMGIKEKPKGKKELQQKRALIYVWIDVGPRLRGGARAGERANDGLGVAEYQMRNRSAMSIRADPSVRLVRRAISILDHKAHHEYSC